MTWDRTDLVSVTDEPLEMGARAVARTGPGIVLDALREAGSQGLCRSQIVAALGCWGNEKDMTEIHTREIAQVISYLCEMGVARVRGDRWYAVTGREMLKVTAA